MKRPLLWIVFLGSVAIVISAGIAACSGQQLPEATAIFGAVATPLLTLATIVVLGLTLRAYQTQFDDQKKQVNEEISRTKQAEFMQMFFNMMQSHHQIVNAFASGTSTGRQLLDDEIDRQLNHKNAGFEDLRPQIREYVRSLGATVRLIAYRCGKSEVEDYMALFRTHLTHNDMRLITAIAPRVIQDNDHYSQWTPVQWLSRLFVAPEE